MWEFIKIIFLAKLVVLTQKPVDIANTYQQKVSVSAINSGASIILDLSETDICQPKKSVDALDCLKEYFSGYEFAVFLMADHKRIYLNTKSFSVSGSNFYIDFRNTEEVDSGMKFNELFISSNIEIRNVIIKWSNAGK